MLTSLRAGDIVKARRRYEILSKHSIEVYMEPLYLSGNYHQLLSLFCLNTINIVITLCLKDSDSCPVLAHIDHGCNCAFRRLYFVAVLVSCPVRF